MTAPIDIECPDCQSSAGNYFTGGGGCRDAGCPIHGGPLNDGESS